MRLLMGREAGLRRECQWQECCECRWVWSLPTRPHPLPTCSLVPDRPSWSRPQGWAPCMKGLTVLILQNLGGESVPVCHE